MLVRNFWGTVTEDWSGEVTEGDNGIVSPSTGEYISMAGVCGDAALNVLQDHTDTIDTEDMSARHIAELVNDYLDCPDIDHVDWRDRNEALVYGAPGRVAMDVPFVRAVWIQVGADKEAALLEALEG